MIEQPAEQSQLAARFAAHLRAGLTPAHFMEKRIGSMPGLLGIEVLAVEPGRVAARLEVQPRLLAPNGYLHAGTVVTLADTCAGYGALAHLPESAKGFTTIELKSNFLSTALKGFISCEALAVHLGRNTQVWDAVVRGPEGKAMAMFRCTQMVLI